MSRLGFSMDSQFYYTIKDCAIVGNHIPQPMLQRWNVETGELLTEYPLHLPAADVAKFKPRPAGESYFCLQTAQLPGTDVLYSVQNEHPDRSKQTYRLYDIVTGECINGQTTLTLSTHLWYLLKTSDAGHHWGCYASSHEPNEPVQIYNLSQGKTVHTISAEDNRRMQYALLSHDKQLLFILWGGAHKEQKTVLPVLAIYEVNTWKCKQRITLPLQPNGVFQMTTVSQDKIDIKYLVRPRQEFQVATVQLRFDPQSSQYVQEEHIPRSAYELSRFLFINTDTVLIEQKLHQNTHPLPEPLLTINNFFNRYGISFIHHQNELECNVYDINSGNLLRRLSGVNEFNHSPVSVNATGHYLADVKQNEGYQFSLLLFDIPHHLWEKLLRWIRYLSWLFILAWPLRYLFQSNTKVVRNSHTIRSRKN